MGVCRTHESGVPRGRHWTVKTRAAPGAGLVAMRQGVDMTTSHRNRTVLNHDSATDGSPHDEHDAEARRSGGTGDISPCGAHADAVGAVLARQALEDAPAGVIGTLARDRGVLVRGRGVTALGSPFRGPSPSARRRRSRICGTTSIGIGSPRGGCSGARGPGPGWGGRRPGPAKARATRGRGRSSGGGRPSRRVRSSSAYRGLDGRERRVPAVAPLAGPVRLRVRPVDSAIRGGRASGSRRPSRRSVWRPRVRAETEEDHD